MANEKKFLVIKFTKSTQKANKQKLQITHFNIILLLRMYRSNKFLLKLLCYNNDNDKTVSIFMFSLSS